MTRVVKEHDERKNELLDVAQTLFYEEGYEKTSIAKIIRAVGVAKGTFYHYFVSKTDLLDQLLERQVRSMLKKIEPVLSDPNLDAIDKMNKAHAVSGQYKVAHKKVFMMLLRALYADENAVLRDKLSKIRMNTVAPIFAKIIEQGISEGHFTTSNAQYAAEMIMGLTNHLFDAVARLLLQAKPTAENKRHLLERSQAYEQAVNRILGAPDGSIHIMSPDMIEPFLGGFES